LARIIPLFTVPALSQTPPPPPLERAVLIDDLLSRLDEPNPNLDALWSREAQERLAPLRRGDVAAAPLETALAK